MESLDCPLKSVKFCSGRQLNYRQITFNLGKLVFYFVKVGLCFSFGDVVFIPNFMKSPRCLPSSPNLAGF